MNQEKLMDCIKKAIEMRINEITDQMEKAMEAVLETEKIRDTKALAGKKVFLTSEDFEYCEAAYITEATYTEHGALLKLKTVSGGHKTRDVKELGKTIFFIEDKALAALKVDEDSNPLNTYLTELIKRFPEYQGKEQEVIDGLCRYQVFELQDCPDYISGKSPAECEACWNRPYKEDKTK